MNPTRPAPAESTPPGRPLTVDGWVAVGWTPWTDPEARARRRLVEAVEEVYAAARALGITVPADRYAPWRLRAEAWLWRTGRLLAVAE